MGRWQYRTLCLGMEEVVPVISLVQLALFIPGYCRCVDEGEVAHLSH